MRKKRRNSLSSAALGLAAGLLIGLLVLQQRQPTNVSAGLSGDAPSTLHYYAGGSSSSSSSNEANKGPPDMDARDRELLYVGVMTAEKYLASRAKAVLETWGSDVPGRIGFYSSETSKVPSECPALPLIALPRVDDSYPPQKKSFLMLQHMWQKYGNRYEWFLRADDDLYVRTDRLERLLRSVDSRRALYVGQAGRGNSEEFGLLSLEYDENFCMGGPGVLISRETLARLVPHIKYCLANLYTTHEDVELGRCVRKFAGISCTWSYEMQSILYHNSSGSLAFTGRLKSREVHRAISLHPVKSPPHMYRLHNYMRGLKIQDLQQKKVDLRRDIEKMQTSLAADSTNRKTELATRKKAERKETGHWDFISRSEYSLSDANPRRRLHSDLREGLEDLTREVMASINACSRQRGRFVEERQALYGYRRRTGKGVDTVLDLLLIYKKYRGRKVTLPVRRHLYLHQTFTEMEWRDVPTSELDHEVVHFLVPVAGRLEAMIRFLNNYERVCLRDPRQADLTVLIVILYPSGEADLQRAMLEQLIEEYGQERVRVVPGKDGFSRARALDQAAKLLGPQDLMFFIDVDISFDSESLERIRRNTLRGQRMYYPVVFSQYDPSVVGAGNETSSLSSIRHTDFNDRLGFWRVFGFGIAAMYRQDYEAVGGFDLSIEGWGKEDVDLFDRTVKSDMEIFRGADSGLVHIYHGVSCDKALKLHQLSMCKGTRADTYASTAQLAEIIYRNPVYLDFAKARRDEAQARANANASVASAAIAPAAA
ncbi:unnamed protein product [Trichogramma brassicae]|uniref:Hexosyltransferase n=1 Tax=Trichogramma brassicae TaxID=86971 RepID=A0A6H5I5Y6_9HYME|nr:unnamed protein product [Trichogramma brassicae]